MRADVVRVEAQLERDVAARGREVDDRARSVVAAVLEDVPLDAGGEERDRLVVAEHEQAVAERLQPDRHLAELRPRRELEPRDTVAGEHADERRAARRATGRRPASASPFGTAPSSQSVTVTPDQRVSTVIVPGR